MRGRAAKKALSLYAGLADDGGTIDKAEVYRFLVKEFGLTYAAIRRLTDAQIKSLLRPDPNADRKDGWTDA